MTRIPVTKARKTLSDVVSHVAFGGDRVVLSRNGRDLAAIIPMDVYRRIEAEEDRLDLADLRRAKREADERGEKPIPYEEVRAALGLAASPARRRRKGSRR
jgi:prevent-host-death family protein